MENIKSIKRIKKRKNENLIDRLIRIFVAEVFLILAFFLIGGILQIIFYILAIVMFATAITGFCALYRLFGFSTYKEGSTSVNKVWLYIIIIFLIIFPMVAGYYSAFMSKKVFLEDYNHMNNYYKQLLFNTGQDNREKSISNYDSLTREYAKFQDKYENYKPLVIKHDTQFNDDLDKVANIINNSKNNVYNGDLTAEHVNLEAVRPIFQDMLKRNNFSMLAVYLVDFHDSMEKIIEAADDKSAQSVIDNYPEVDAKLKSVEEVASDSEIQAIRSNLETLLQSAQANNIEVLPAQATTLKSSFVKVYLQRG